MSDCSCEEIKAVLTINLTPSKTSELANDSDFVTEYRLQEALENLQLPDSSDTSHFVTKTGQDTLFNKTLVEPTIKNELNIIGDEGIGETFNISFLNGTTQIATNNGLDFLPGVNFVINPTVETDVSMENLLPNNLVNKKQILQLIKYADEETAKIGFDDASIMTPLKTSQVIYDNVGRGIQLGFNGTLENNILTFETSDKEPYILRHNYDYEVDLLFEAAGTLDDNIQIIIKNNTDTINIVNVLHDDFTTPITVKDLKQVMKYSADIGFRWIFRVRCVIKDGRTIFIMPSTVVNIPQVSVDLSNYYTSQQVDEIIADTPALSGNPDRWVLIGTPDSITLTTSLQPVFMPATTRFPNLPPESMEPNADGTGIKFKKAGLIHFKRNVSLGGANCENLYYEARINGQALEPLQAQAVSVSQNTMNYSIEFYWQVSANQELTIWANCLQDTCPLNYRGVTTMIEYI